MNPSMITAALAALAAATALAELDRFARRRDPADGGDAAVGRAGALGRRMLRTGGQSAPGVQHALVGSVAGCSAWAAGGPVSAIVVGLSVAAMSVLRVRRAEARRRRARERAAPAFARALADALRGGASVRSGLEQTAGDRAIPSALRSDLVEFSGAIALGLGLGPTLSELAERGGANLRLMCGTIAMHLEAGGALAGQLERLATDGETATKIDEERVAATSQARATVRVVAALPILALLGAEAASGGFVERIWGNPIAFGLLLLGFVLEAVAFAVARMIAGGRR